MRQDEVRQDIATTWTHDLSDQQREQLAWLRRHKCRFEAVGLPPAAPGGPPELLLEVFLDAYAVVRERGENVQEVFARAAENTSALLRLAAAQDVK